MLETALEDVLQHPVEIVAAGRTDAGVHALGQVISLRTTNGMPLARIPWVVNRLLPASISIRRVDERESTFHARYSARYRRYRYVLQSTRWPDPIRGRFSWQYDRTLNLEAMQTAVRPLIGCHNFAAFCHRSSLPALPIRTVQRLSVHPWRDYFLVDVQADAFLRQMIRLLVANLVLIGSGVRPASWLEELLHSQNRFLAGKSAPPCGLFLMRVGYTPFLEYPQVGEVAGDEAYE